MQILTELNKNPNLSLALGYFDGVHLGHQAVIGKAVEYARTNGGKSAVITFRDHPCCFFWGVAHAMWHVRSLTRDGTHNPSIGSTVLTTSEVP